MTYTALEFNKLSEYIVFMEAGNIIHGYPNAQLTENNDTEDLVPLSIKQVCSYFGSGSRLFTKLDSWETQVTENAPVLCWVSDVKTVPNQRLGVISSVIGGHNYPYREPNGAPWAYAVPLSKSEIQQFLNNVPE